MLKSVEAASKLWRVRIHWLDRSTDYDLHVRHEMAGELHDSGSASSHQHNRLPRNWEEVALETVTGSELVELRLFSGHADSSLAVEVRDPDGRLLQSTNIGFLFRDACVDGRHAETRTVVMLDLLPHN